MTSDFKKLIIYSTVLSGRSQAAIDPQKPATDSPGSGRPTSSLQQTGYEHLVLVPSL